MDVLTEAGQFVVNLNLDSVEQVIDKIKSFQYNHESIYVKPRKDVREVRVSSDEATSSDDETVVRVRKLKQWKTSTTDEKQKADTRLTDLSKQMGDTKDGIFSLLQLLENMQPRTTNTSTKPARSRSPSPCSGRYFHYNGLGHFAKN
jgi:hypothetical protein